MVIQKEQGYEKYGKFDREFSSKLKSTVSRMLRSHLGCQLASASLAQKRQEQIFLTDANPTGIEFRKIREI